MKGNIYLCCLGSLDSTGNFSAQSQEPSQEPLQGECDLHVSVCLHINPPPQTSLFPIGESF